MKKGTGQLRCKILGSYKRFGVWTGSPPTTFNSKFTQTPQKQMSADYNRTGGMGLQISFRYRFLSRAENAVEPMVLRLSEFIGIVVAALYWNYYYLVLYGLVLTVFGVCLANGGRRPSQFLLPALATASAVSCEMASLGTARWTIYVCKTGQKEVIRAKATAVREKLLRVTPKRSDPLFCRRSNASPCFARPPRRPAMLGACLSSTPNSLPEI